MNVSDDIRKMLPEFFNRIDKGEVHVYDAGGFTRELTDEMKKKIEEMEKEWKVKVIAVTDGVYVFPGEDKVHMIAYIYDDGYEPWAIDNMNVGFMANVVNDTWDIEESGSIGLLERVGCVMRSY